MNKPIIILFKNHEIKIKPEKELTEKDISLAKYLLINSSHDEVSRNFMVVEPTKSLLFSKAIIKYQIKIEGLYTKNENKNNENYIHYLEPIKVETDSLSDLCNLVGNIDKLILLNLFTVNNQIPNLFGIQIAYFGIKLYDSKGKMFYDKFYHDNKSFERYMIKGKDFDISSCAALSYTVRRRFENLLDPSPLSYIVAKSHNGIITPNHSFLFLADDQSWSITNYDDRNGLIGIPLKLSNTITFCTDSELKNIMKYEKSCVTYTIHDGINNHQLHELITEVLESAEYDKIENFCYNIEYDVISYKDINKVKSDERYLLLDILSNIGYIIDMSNILFSDLCNRDVSSNEIETIISINFFNDKVLYFNNETIIPLRDILNII